MKQAKSNSVTHILILGFAFLLTNRINAQSEPQAPTIQIGKSFDIGGFVSFAVPKQKHKYIAKTSVVHTRWRSHYNKYLISGFLNYTFAKRWHAGIVGQVQLWEYRNNPNYSTRRPLNKAGFTFGYSIIQKQKYALRLSHTIGVQKPFFVFDEGTKVFNEPSLMGQFWIRERFALWGSFSCSVFKVDKPEIQQWDTFYIVRYSVGMSCRF